MSRSLVRIGVVASICLLACTSLAAQTSKKGQSSAPAERPDETTLLPGRDPSLPPGAMLRLGGTVLRHPSAVWGLVWSPNGKTIISSGDDGTRFWHAERGVLLHTWPEAKQSLLVVSPDNRTVAAAGADGVIRLWNVQNAVPGHSMVVAPPDAKPVQVTGLAFSPNGQQLACTVAAREQGDSDAFVRLFDVATGKEKNRFKDVANGSYAIAFSPNGKLLAAGEGRWGSFRGDTEIRVWSIATGEVLHRLPGQASWVEHLSFSDDGQTLVSSCFHETKLWHVADQRELFCWKGARHGRFTVGDKYIVTIRGDSLVVSKGRSDQILSRIRLQGANDSAKQWAMAPDGETLATADDAGLIHLWNVATGTERALYASHRGTIQAAVWSPDGSLILTGGSDNTLRIWGAATGLQLRVIELPAATQRWSKNTASLGFTGDGRSFFAGQEDGAIRMWSVATGKLIHKLTGHQNWITAVAGPPRGEFLASAGWDGALCLWDLTKAGPPRFLMGGQGEPYLDTSIAAIAFAPNGKQVVAAATSDRLGRNQDKQKTLRLWDVATGQLLREFGPAGSRVMPKRVVWPTPRELYVESNQSIQQWDPQTGGLIHEYSTRHKNWTETPAFGVSGDGKLLAIGDNDGIHLWDTLSHQKFHTIAGPALRSECLTLSPDGKRLLAGYAGGTLLVWDLAALAIPPEPKAVPPEGKNPQATNNENYPRWWEALGHWQVGDNLVALWRFVRARDDATAWLGQNVPVAVARDPQQLPKLIKSLSDADAQVRATALSDLAEFGESAAPALHEALREPLPVPVLRRLELALAFINEHPIHPNELRGLRAVEILERIGTAAAEQTLERWSRGAPKAPATAAARDAWQRVQALRRLTPTPVLSDAEIDRLERPKIGSRRPRLLDRMPGPVTVVAFSPDGKRLICGGPKSPLRFYEVASGRLIREIEDFPAVACAVAGSRFAAASAEGRLLIGHFDNHDDRYIKDRGAIACVALSPDGTVFAAGTGDGFLGLWTTDGKKLHTAKTSLKRVTAVAFLPDGKSVLLGGIVDELANFNGPLRFTQLAPITQWSVADAKEMRRFEARGTSLALHPDGRTLLAGGLARFFAKNWRGGGFISIDDVTFTQGNKLAFWDLQRDREIRTIDAKGARPMFNQAGDLVLAWGEDEHQQSAVDWTTNTMWGGASNDAYVHVLDSMSACAVPLGAELRATAVALAADGHTLAWSAATGAVTVWDLRPAGPPAQPEIDRWWEDLRDVTDGRAWQAMWNLSAFPNDTMALLRRQLRPIPLAIGSRIDDLLVELENPSFVRRDRASAELKNLGRIAEHALLHARAKSSGAEASRRLDALLAALATPPAEEIRALRAVHLLHLVATAEARQLLEELSRGYSQAQLTQEAQRLLR